MRNGTSCILLGYRSLTQRRIHSSIDLSLSPTYFVIDLSGIKYQSGYFCKSTLCDT